MTVLARPLALAAAVAAAALAPALAQRAAPADKYHQAAGHYVAGDLAPAEAAARAGLALAPDDPKLQALLDLITQDQDQQDGDQNQDPEGDSGDDGQQPDAEPGQDGPPDGGQSGDPDGQDDGAPDGDPGSGEPDDAQTERDGTDQGRNESGENDAAQEPGGRPSDGGGDARQGEPGTGGQMSAAQAERLLDAVGGDERLLLRELQRVQTRGRRGSKDW